MNERIKELRKELKLTMESFGAKVGIGKSAINKIEKGINNVTEQMIKSICREFHVNEEWLRSGTGDMFSPVPNNALDRLAEAFNLDSLERTIIEEYLKLDPSRRKVIKDYITSIAQTKVTLEVVKETPSHITSFKRRMIAYYGKLASAGDGQLIFDELPVDTIEIPDIPEYSSVTYAISVDGNSMEPRFFDSDILLVDTTGEVSPDDIGIFFVDDKTYVKQLGKKELISINKDYPNIPLDETARCFGKVVDTLPIQF